MHTHTHTLTHKYIFIYKYIFYIKDQKAALIDFLGRKIPSYLFLTVYIKKYECKKNRIIRFRDDGFQ